MTAELLVVGLSHRTAPLALREQLAVAPDTLPHELQALLQHPAMGEGVLISTCNRVEVYAASAQPVAAADAVREYLSARAPEPLDRYLYERWGTDAVRHAFRVTSSLDSMVVGEPQILGQVKQAFEAAEAAGTLGTLLGRCFSRAFAVSKRVRTETGVAEGSVSVSSIGVDLAHKVFGELRGRRVLLVGAGKMGEAAARRLARSGAELHVVNRSPERAEELARSCGGEARGYELLAQELVHADVVITSTGSERFIVSSELMRDVTRARKHRPLFFIDIAVPRDVDPRVGEMDSVFLYDVDDLQHIAHDNLAARRREAQKAEHIAEGEVEEFDRWRKSLELAPTITALRERVRSVVQGELERTLPRLKHLDDKERKALDKMCDAITNKLLHSPVTQLREGAEGPDGAALIAAVRRLFELSADAQQQGSESGSEKKDEERSGLIRFAPAASNRGGEHS
jgi:glutamyl-tRNA reductase